ncbi:MAG: endopeptidase La [Acidobacteriota bacterium]
MKENDHPQDQADPLLRMTNMIFKARKEREGMEWQELPILPVKGTVLFPETIIPILVGKKGSLELIEEAMNGEGIIGICALKNQEADPIDIPDILPVGTKAKVVKTVKLPDGNLNVILRGLSRMQLIEFVAKAPFFRARVAEIPEDTSDEPEIRALEENLKNQAIRAIKLIPTIPDEISVMISSIDRPGYLADLIASNLNVSVLEKYEILEALTLKDRLEKVTVLVNRKIEILELGNKIQSQVKGEIDKSQREYYLREQLKAIQRELGEKDDKSIETEELKERLERKRLPEEVRKVAEKELDRLSKIPPQAAEYIVSRTYLDWILDLPWMEGTEDNLHISTAERVLEEDHYDLTKVKKRILEYLAVRKLKNDMKGPILCLVGPPGVGKTSLGRSIARAMGRKFVRVSLGGIRDEAEIRGHRRTYVGSLPGRVIQGIKKAQSNNPIFMLDEIDKLGIDFRGDPSSALLEVLDPEQNFSFSDHYLEVPFDLSKVMFIATANLLEPIPPALKDRLEVLELPGYSADEKIHIAQKFLIPKQVSEHGLKEDQIRFKEEALQDIIHSYTREAGVRNLEREIATICRGVAREVVEGRSESALIAEQELAKYLGPIKFFSEVAGRTMEPGIAIGLAWTPVGGDIIFVEAAKMKGKSNLTLTGKLGDVMKESAQAALGFIRSNAVELGIDEDMFEKVDIHIHVPSGAIPKDGPSAGITILTALTSLMTSMPVNPEIAMTGEITLRGTVLPVGGIKEKVLAALRAGLKQVILPEQNRKDLEDIPPNVQDQMAFHFVSTMAEVLNLALGDSKRLRKAEKKARPTRLAPLNP